MKRTKEEAETTRASIIDASLRVFCRRGYAATSLEEIAVEASVTRGAIYHHFDGKVGLYNALVEAKTQRARSLLRDLAIEGGSAAEKLRKLMIRALSLLEEDEEYRLVQDLNLFKTAYAEELERGMELKRASMALIEQILADIIKAGIVAGEFRRDLKPKAAAISLAGMLNGVSISWLLDPRRFSIKSMAEPIADSFLKGLMA